MEGNILLRQAIVFPKVKEHENPTADAYSVIKQNT